MGYISPVDAHVLLNLFVAGYGYHEASWKVSGLEHPGRLSLDHFAGIARTAERGTLDSLFFADSPGVAPFRTQFMAQAGYDPIDLLAALAATTEHIGLLATASTTYSEPWDLARRFATIDHLSDGRAGWNIVTTTSPIAAGNFGSRPHPPHADRYARAEEFVEAVVKVWDAWDEDAVVASIDSGIWADPREAAPARAPGRAVLGGGHPAVPALAAGASADGTGGSLRRGRRPGRPLRRRRIHPAADGRRRRRVPGSSARLGRAPRPSARRYPRPARPLLRAREHRRGGTGGVGRADRRLREEFRYRNLAHLAGVDPAAAMAVDPDGPFPYELFEAERPAKTFGEAVIRAAKDGDLTFRQAAQKFATLPGGLHFTGTPEGLADLIETWWRAGAADGFTLQPLRLPRDLELFVDHVVPILRQRAVCPPRVRARNAARSPRAGPGVGERKHRRR